MKFIDIINIELLVYHIQLTKWYFANIKEPFHILKTKIQYRIEHIYMNTRLWLKHKNKYRRAFIIMRWCDIDAIRIKRYNREQEIKISEQYTQLEKDTGISQWSWRTFLEQ